MEQWEKVLAVSDDVARALRGNVPVVALESTIITHGLPWPQNLAVARDIESAVREAGAVPATIAVFDGKIRVGLDDPQLEMLARSTGAMKLSRADLAFATAAGRTGSTTVAATMIAAALAGISVFATGGIGGVHRGAEETFDISADLEELARTPVVVVSAGAKAILDLPKTLEVLETRGVPVIGWKTSEFPAFWSQSSGLAVPLRCDDVDEISLFLDHRAAMGLTGGVLLANPVPAAASIDRSEIEAAIRIALADALAAGIQGKQVTPFLLARMVELTNGRSLTANRALILNNAHVAAMLASAISRSRGRQSAAG